MRRNAVILALMAVVAAAVAAGNQLISRQAFDTLEAETVSGDATRVAVAVSYEVRLIAGYGSTNAIWDSSYADVSTGDRETFAGDFPPADLLGLYDIDVAVGVDAAGRVRVGGKADGEEFTDLPEELTPAVLAQMADVRAEAGVSRCGVVLTSAVPYLYCGFASRRTDGSAPRPYGLIFMRALNAKTIKRLSDSTSMELRLSDAGPSAPQVQLDTRAGALKAGTRVLSGEQLQLDMSLPALGGTLALASTRGRPIHAAAVHVATVTMTVMAIGAALLAVLIMVLVRRNLRAQVGPLRVTTEDIITSGDQSLRVPVSGSGDIAALGSLINSMLDRLAAHAAEVETDQESNARRIEDSYRRQREAATQVGDRAQHLVNTTVQAVVAELTTVLEQAESVQAAARDIGERTGETGRVTETVQRSAELAGTALNRLTGKMDEVRGITSVISGIAGQTRMLALNATIEAERAAGYGRGFAVVAGEVKDLAGSTASSAGRIDDTTTTVTRMTDEVSAAIAEVSSGVEVINGAAEAVSGVVETQTGTVAALVTAVRGSISRIESMGSLAENVERRDLARSAAVGRAELTWAGGATAVDMRDMSNAGLQVLLEPGQTLERGQRVEVTLPARYDRHRLAAEVIWVRPDGAAVLAGLQLIDPPAGYLAMLARTGGH